jgi:hypothetical protein
MNDVMDTHPAYVTSYLIGITEDCLDYINCHWVIIKVSIRYSGGVR